MNIKNIATLALILVTSIHAMEVPHSNMVQSSAEELLWEIDKLCETISTSKELHNYAQSNTFLSSSNAVTEVIESPASQKLLTLVNHDINILNRYKSVAATEVFEQYKDAKINDMPEGVINFCKKDLYAISEFKDFMHVTQQKNNQQTSNFYTSNVEQFNASLKNLKTKQYLYQSTPQYQAYEKAKTLHEKYNTPETDMLVEEAAGLIFTTPEHHAFQQALHKHAHLVSERELVLKREKVLISNGAFSNKTEDKIQTYEFIQNSQKIPKFEIHNNQDLSLCMFEELQSKIMKKLNLKELKFELISDKAPEKSHKKNDCIIYITHK